jgi:hypothetical protein
LNLLLAQVEIASVNSGDDSARAATQACQNRLRSQIRELEYSGTGAFTKCDFFITPENVAEQWNTPKDGSVPCNGVRTDCPFYTGKEWKYATEEKTGPGFPVLAEAIQEIRFRSDDWARFPNPEEEFRTRFSVPFLWAFKEYVPISGQPDVRDMLLYRPKVLYGRDTGLDQWETILMEKVEVGNLTGEEFEPEKTRSRTQPGSPAEQLSRPPQFPTLIDQFSVPSNVRLAVTHPPQNASSNLFVYRTWSPDKNKISLFGTGTPGSTVFIINNTALRSRQSYHNEWGTVDFAELPTSLPGAPNFTNITATVLNDEVITPLRQEKASNSDQRAITPLGFDEASIGTDGFWSSIQEIELVHNTVNEIFVLLIAGETAILSEQVFVDYRFMHSVISQTSFDGVDFTISPAFEGNDLGALTGSDVVQKAIITANPVTLVSPRGESPSFSYGYYGLRFKDRNLRFGTQAVDNDLQSSNPSLEATGNLLVTEAGPSTFINGVGYQVVQYRKEIQVSDWYVVNDCGFMMLVFDDNELHRVLPLPNQEGENPPLTNVFVNGGGTGSVVAQWAIEKLEIQTPLGTKPLVQFYRDPDGVGLPANYVLVGPDSSAENAFGRPDPERDVITATVTFLRPQSGAGPELGETPEENLSPAELSDEVVDLNFHSDTVRLRDFKLSFDESGTLTAGGERLSSGEIGDDPPFHLSQQEYVWVFEDATGRPIGRKYSRMMVSYYNLACPNVEIFYAWTSDCETAALIPDLSLAVGNSSGQTGVSVRATTDPSDPGLSLGFRIKNLLGSRDCRTIANCGDHEFLKLGPLRREFEVVANVQGGSCNSAGTFEADEDAEVRALKAFYPSAGQAVGGEIIPSLTQPPGSQFLKRRGPMWFPYTVCERPRYDFRTNGPLGTDSTELINKEGTPPGVSGASFSASQASSAGTGCFEGLPPQHDEAYRAPDRMVPKILDIHPSLRPCTSAYTYGNQILRGGEATFSGYARIRGEIDLFWYEGIPGWTAGPFSNIGRPKAMAEVAEKVGDFRDGNAVGFRWMPMFPEREDMGAGIELFGEEIEPQHYRLTCISTPLGTLSESVPSDQTRLRQKEMIHNRVGGAIEYPYVPYFPSFLPDASLGTDSSQRDPQGNEGDILGPITTMWAWREQEGIIKRGQQSTPPLAGIELALPQYFIDNRRLEIRLRPEERNHTLQWTPPTYNSDGSMDSPAQLKLGLDGPAREIDLDFKTRTFGVRFQPDTVYDTTKQIGDTPFPCSNGTRTDNERLSPTCTCITDVEAEGVDQQNLPSRFLHLDELAPDGYFSLYENTTLNTPFAIDYASNASPETPCCICIYYLRGLYFRLNAEFIPSEVVPGAQVDPRLSPTYTWSRVPHGYDTNTGTDGNNWGAAENRSDDFLATENGNVFTQDIQPGEREIRFPEQMAVFPSIRLAEEKIAEDDGISVRDLPPGDPKLKGGRPALEGISRGQTEQIVLTLSFSTYVRLNDIEIDFAAGEGFEVPPYDVVLVDPNQIGTGTYPSQEQGYLLGSSSTTAIESNVPGTNPDSNSDAELVREGRFKFNTRVTPGYSDTPFWRQFSTRFHFVFNARGNAQSMGIAAIRLNANALIPGGSGTELIFVPERKYYRSIGSPVGTKNPEQVLGAFDSATVYWRTIGQGSEKGANRFRAYGWGSKVDDASSNPIESSDIQQLELLQSIEYDKARNQLSVPYTFQFRSYIPRDEAQWLRFLNEGDPNWLCTLTNFPSLLQDIVTSGGTPRFGAIPFREPFNPPGHAWVWKMSDETYSGCCDGCPDQQLIDFEYLHLHDNLSIVETARFWDELPSGFTRLIRSTLMAPDVTFGQSNESGRSLSGDSSGRPVLLDEALFEDIPVDVLENSGFARSDDGDGFVIVDRGST